jgi:O-antigen/teichoic acid export membrane protein
LVAILKRKLQSGDIGFLKSSAIVTLGFTFARILGLGFSLLLARLLTSDTFGFIQYSLSIGMIMAGLTQPFAQHVLARFISVNNDDRRRLNEILSSYWVVMAVLFALTLLVVLPLMILTDTLNVGAIIVFIGLTIFYTYYGIARGLVASGKLVAVFLGSNLLQLIIIFILYGLMGRQDPLPAIAIYGLSYLIPIALLITFAPFDLAAEFRFIKLSRIKEMVRFALPVWVSQFAFVIAQNIDLLLLQRFLDNRAVGMYAFTRTLCLAFDFVPMAIYTVLMPRIAAADKSSRRRLLAFALGITIVINTIGLILFGLLYEWIITTFFGSDYLLPLRVALIMAIAQSLWGLHGIISNAMIGINSAAIEALNRILLVIVFPILGFILIPAFGIEGAALMNLSGSIIGLIAFPVILRIGRRRTSQASAEKPIDYTYFTPITGD